MSKLSREKLERLGNPILIKEMYQSLHNRQFLTAMWGVLGIALFTYIVVYALDMTPYGRTMFPIFCWLIAFIGCLLLPLQSCITLSREIQDRTIELLNITCMNSTSQVLGRLAATLVQLTLLYAVIAPFAAVAYLLRGIGIGNIAICLIFLFLISAIICSIGLFFGALSMPQGSRNLPRVFGFGIGLIGFLMLMQAPQVLFARRGLWLELAEGGGTVILITAIFTPLLCMLFVSSASTLLTFEADKSWGQSKLSVLLILLALLGLLAGFNTFSKTNIDTDVLKVSTITAYVLVSAATVLFFVLPNRIRYKRIQKLEHRNRIWRLIYYPFMDGPMPALVFFYLCCGILLGSLRLLVETGNFPGVSGEAWLAQGLLLIYAPYLAMIAAGIEKIMINRENRISSKRVMILLSVIIVCMFPIFFIAGARIFEEMTNPATALLPFYYLVFWDDVHEKITLTQLIGPILVGVVLPLFGIATHLIQFLGTDDLSSFNSK